jgi:hypothetical protein
MTSVWSESVGAPLAGFVPPADGEDEGYDGSSPFRQEYLVAPASHEPGSGEASSLWGESFPDAAGFGESGFGESGGETGFGAERFAEPAFGAVAPPALGDVNTLTNIVFFARHPERRGRGLSSAEPGYRELGDEWTTIRDTVVALGALTARAAVHAGRTGLRREGPDHELFAAGRDDEAPSYIETALARSAVAAGKTDVNTLCDMIFFKRHPERNGRLISRSEPNYGQLSAEWLAIRDTLVLPILRGAPATPAPAPRPWPPSPSPGRPVPGGPTPGGPLPTADRAALLTKLKGYVESGRIAFAQAAERTAMTNGTGAVRREDGTTASIDTRVLRVCVALVEKGLTFQVYTAIVGHDKNVKGTTDISNHWYGRAIDVNEINGKDIDGDGEAAKPDTIRFMQALNSLRGTDLVPRTVICSGNGREDPDVLNLQIGVRENRAISGHTNHVHVDY